MCKIHEYPVMEMWRAEQDALKIEDRWRAGFIEEELLTLVIKYFVGE